VKNDHNMWDYIYFSIYLDHIDISDHNAIESFVYNMVRAFSNPLENVGMFTAGAVALLGQYYSCFVFFCFFFGTLLSSS